MGGADTAASFDGTSGDVDVPGVTSASFSSGFTIEAWVKSAAVQQDSGIVGKWSHSFGGVLLWIDTSGNYSLAVTARKSNYLTTSVAPKVGTWEHVVGTWDGAMLRLYVDGREIGSRAFAGVPGLPTNDLQIGDYADSDKYFDGALDEVALYDHALTADQIAAQQLGCVDLAGAAGPSYVPTTDVVDSPIRVVVSATNAAGERSAASELSTPVSAAPPPPAVTPTNVTPPTIAGTPRDGETLTAAEGTWTGTPPLTYAYQWQNCNADGLTCADIPTATAATYTLTQSDVGGTVRVVVSASGSSGASSDPSPVIAAAPPTDTSPPTLDTPTEGETVTATPGTWAGTAPLTYAYSWERCGEAACTHIDGVTGSTYIPVAADVGRSLRVTVRASNDAGEASASTESSAPVVLGTGFSSAQLWPYASGVAAFWPKASAPAEKIAHLRSRSSTRASTPRARTSATASCNRSR